MLARGWLLLHETGAWAQKYSQEIVWHFFYGSSPSVQNVFLTVSYDALSHLSAICGCVESNAVLLGATLFDPGVAVH